MPSGEQRKRQKHRDVGDPNTVSGYPAREGEDAETQAHPREAQALTDRLAIIASGVIVAEGTPESLGGRDTAAAHIRFQLPPGVSAADLLATLILLSPIALFETETGFVKSGSICKSSNGRRN